jgi:UDP-N-acetylmuramyl pentapeptide phosphotransferase/UDP-N-acetylglucosamine-1-phosphate transferase
METYFLIAILLLAASYIYLKLAVKFNIIDKPNERSSHTKVTIRGGGIIFTIAILLFYFLNGYQYPFFTLAVIIVSIVSFLDDIYTLSSKIRFPIQLLAMLLVLHQAQLPFEPMYVYLLILVCGLGIVNFFNFMDGINGITGIYSLAVLSGFFMINNQEQLMDQDLIIYAMISLVVFGFYNFRKKAIFFAGDIGSITIGIMIVFIWVLFMIQLSSPLMLFFVVVYGADAVLTLFYRKLYTKESIFDPHRLHIYQKLVHNKGISHLKVSMLYGLLQFSINCIIIVNYQKSIQFQWMLAIVLTLVLISTYLLVFRKLQQATI